MASEDRSFGVVLIEQGHEVGGEDRRSSIGTLARVLETEQAPDGRWAVISVGVRRFRVGQWLPDNPFPQALIEEWPDESVASGEQTDRYQTLLGQHRRLLALTSEIGHNVGPIQELSDDPTLGSFQIAATAPLSSLDRYQALAAPTLEDRLDLIEVTLESALLLAELELGQAMIDPLGDTDN